MRQSKTAKSCVSRSRLLLSAGLVLLAACTRAEPAGLTANTQPEESTIEVAPTTEGAAPKTSQTSEPPVSISEAGQTVPEPSEQSANEQADEEPVDQDNGTPPSVPEGTKPVPELTEATIEDHPLLAGVLLPDECLSDPECVRHSAMIGISRYLLVDDEGNPIELGDDDYKQRTMTIWAYHGADEPVIYWMAFNRSFIHEEFGFSTACDGGVLGILNKSPGQNSYWFSTTGEFNVFDNRWFFGDDCSTDDTTDIPVLNGAFTIDVDGQESLILIGDDSATARFKWIPVDW